jgi:catechol-2,3-dioxygenase
MRITSLELQALDLESQRDFYRDVLGLPVNLAVATHGLASLLYVAAGWTELRFVQAPSGGTARYHFAFNIPENQFESALAWTGARAEILADNAGETVFPSESWNADALYFKDPAGNILEFIARHELRNSTAEPFAGGSQILCVSEIGLGAEHVPGLADRFKETIGIVPFKGQRSEEFTAMGDDEGLFIIVKRDRIWRPDSGIPAELLPVDVTVDAGGKMYEVRGVPYEVLAMP